MLKIANIAGARPNFMKIAPLIHEIDRRSDVIQRLVHTGQHYDDTMSKVFFEQLDIPRPDVNLNVGPGERLAQIDRIMERFEPVLKDESPDLVLVVGDVNSTVACARVAKAAGIAVAHVEAGLRSFDRDMPEELNRIETDELSDLLFVTEPSGMANLEAEGVQGSAHLVGNVMIDTLVANLSKVRERAMAQDLGLVVGEYMVGTFHRPSNVDGREALSRVVAIVEAICDRMDLVLPLHPRTRKSLDAHGMLTGIRGNPRLHLIEPLGYLEFISLVADSAGVVTDSGGIQEESTFLGIPCVTMRENTERPITVDVGTNALAGTTVEGVTSALEAVFSGIVKSARVPCLWDGAAAGRIIDVIERIGVV